MIHNGTSTPFLNAILVSRVVADFERSQTPLDLKRLNRLSRLPDTHLVSLLKKLEKLTSEERIRRLAAFDEICQIYWNELFIAAKTRDEATSP